MTKAQNTPAEQIINPSQYLLELANAKDSGALQGDNFTPARVAEIARQCVAERNALLEACNSALNYFGTKEKMYHQLMDAIAKATGQAA